MSSSTEARPLRRRADAERNRSLLLAAARDAFAAADDEAAVSLEAIARSAGVGIGTLYRNFGTREALVEALYGSELDEVTAAADALVAGHPGDEALRHWAERYGRFVAAKRGMLGALRASVGGPERMRNETRGRIVATVGRLLAVGVADGTLRGDVDADDVTDLLVGLFVATDPRSAERVRRLLDVLVDGLRPRP